MLEEVFEIHELTFNVSYDALHFQPIFTLSSTGIYKALQNNKTLFSIINSIFQSARQTLDTTRAQYKINIQYEKWAIILTDSFSQHQNHFSLLKLESITDRNLAYQRFETLTNKEREVFKMILNKKKQSQVISVMCISINTFKTHKKNIYKKMAFKDRDDLIEWAKLHAEIIN